MAIGEKNAITMAVKSPVAGNLPVLTAVGQLQDSGLTPSQAGVRPNLLDNWYFASPFVVNQRGLTAYSNGENSIDRWRCFFSGIVVDTDGISIQPNSNFLQIRGDKFLVDKELTGSLLLSDGSLISGTAVIPTNGNGEFYRDSRISLHYESNQSYSFTSFIVTAFTEAIKIVAAKLELGRSQTLARQNDNGQWELLEVPDYGTELQKCQRYYEQTAYHTCYGVANSTTEIITASSIEYVAQKRPAITVSVNSSPVQPLEVAVCDSTMQFIDGCVLMTPTAYNLSMLSPRIVNEAGQFTVGQIYRIQLPDNAYIIDATL